MAFCASSHSCRLVASRTTLRLCRLHVPALLLAVALGACSAGGSAGSDETAEVDGALTPTTTVAVYGKSDTFGGLAGLTTLPSGHSVSTVPVDGWGLNPGQAAYFTALTPDGQVVIANEP